MIDFFVQMPNLQFGFQIDFVIVFPPHTVPRLGTVLTHHDDRRLNGGETRKNQVEQNEWIRIEAAIQQENRIKDNPTEQHRTEQDDEFPTAAELSDAVGESLAERQFLFELFADVAGKNLVLLQTLDHLLVERREFANLVLQNPFDIFFAEFAKVVQADEPFAVQVGQFLLDKLEERRPNQFGDHSVVRRVRFFANLTD